MQTKTYAANDCKSFESYIQATEKDGVSGLSLISEAYSTMTKPTALAQAIYQECSATVTRTHACRWLIASSALALAACSSTPLPPWPDTTQLPPSAAPSPAAAAVQIQGTGAAATITPVAPNTRLQALPYSAEVAALFPDPSEHYSTPGLSDERSTFTSNAELVEVLQTLSQQNSNDQIRLGLLNSGNAQSGAVISALVATKATAITPMAMDDTKLPTVLIVAAQKGTDAAATEATLVLAKELGTGGLLAPLLDRINIILVPRANPDGFERGTSTTADGTDLRFDHLQLKTPEARFLAKLTRDYRPSVIVDAGEFAAMAPSLQQLNAVRANDVGLQYALTANAHEFITKAAREWMHEPAVKALSQAGLRVDWAYQAASNSAEDGFAMGTLEPTTLRNTASLKNMVSMHIESRGADLGRTHLQRRVHSHVQSMTAILQSAAQRSGDLRKVQTFVNRDVASQACRHTLTVQAQPRVEQRELALVNTASAQIQPTTVTWRNSLSLQSPRTRGHACGYWLSADAIEATERLSMLGVVVHRVGELSSLQAETYHANTAAPNSSATPSAVNLSRATLEAAPGSFYISMNQPFAYLAAAALEPDTPYSYYSNGIIKSLAEAARVVATPNIVFEEE